MTRKSGSLISNKQSLVPDELNHLLNTVLQNIHGLHSIRVRSVLIYSKERQYTSWRVQVTKRPLVALRYLQKIHLKHNLPILYELFDLHTCQ